MQLLLQQPQLQSEAKPHEYFAMHDLTAHQDQIHLETATHVIYLSHSATVKAVPLFNAGLNKTSKPDACLRSFILVIKL